MLYLKKQLLPQQEFENKNLFQSLGPPLGKKSNMILMLNQKKIQSLQLHLLLLLLDQGQKPKQCLTFQYPEHLLKQNAIKLEQPLVDKLYSKVNGFQRKNMEWLVIQIDKVQMQSVTFIAEFQKLLTLTETNYQQHIMFMNMKMLKIFTAFKFKGWKKQKISLNKTQLIQLELQLLRSDILTKVNINLIFQKVLILMNFLLMGINMFM